MPNDEQPDAAHPQTTAIITCDVTAGQTLDVDSVCDQILAAFPGAIITAENWFAARRESIEECRTDSQERLRNGTLPSWAWKTIEELNWAYDQFIADNHRAELRSGGQQKALAIPLNNGVQLKVRIGARFILVLGQCRRSDATITNLARFLESLNIGKVEILEHDPRQAGSPN